MKKISIKIWLPVIVITLAIFAFLVYSGWMKTINAFDDVRLQLASKEKPVPQIPSDWKTYRNEEFGIEFKYPKEYSINRTIDYKNPDDIHFYDPESELVFSLLMSSSQEELPYFNITITKAEYDNIESWTENFLRESKKPYYFEGEEFPPVRIVSVDDLVISNIKVKKITEEYAIYCRQCVMIIGIKNNYFYNFNAKKSEEEFTQYEKALIERMLSTFKFLE